MEMGRADPVPFLFKDSARIMMDQERWEEALQGLDLGPRYYFDQVGSSNDVAEKMIDEGTPDLTLIVADEQVQGRGRQGRAWYTPPGSALAFSLVLLPRKALQRATYLQRLNGLGALAVARAVREVYGLEAEIKWPNDVLLKGKKVCGVLVESRWKQGRLQDAVLGVGVNVGPASVPAREDVRFPATSLEEAVGRDIDRTRLLAAILKELLAWYPRLDTGGFVAAWENLLAFTGDVIQLQVEDRIAVQGKIAGLAEDGSLRVEKDSGEVEKYRIGEIQLRPVDRSKK